MLNKNARSRKQSLPSFSRSLSARRRAAGLSLKTVATRLGVTKSYVSKLESGKSRPAPEMAERIALLLGVEPRVFLMAAGYLPDDVRNIFVRHPNEAVSLLRERFSEYGRDSRSSQGKSREPSRGLGRLYTLVHADCLQWLQQRDANSIQAIVTDPPYGLKEYSLEEKAKLRRGKGGVWRIPPSLGGYERSPLPRFTVLSREEREAIHDFFLQWGKRVLRVLVPGGHVFIATNPLVSTNLYAALEASGLEKRGEIIRLVQTLRGGDRPKNAHKEFSDVTVIPRSCWEPWGLFRKPCEGRVQDNLRNWKTGGLRRISEDQPFCDVIRSAPTRSSERELGPHPSLKPQAFMRQIVRASLPLGEGVVLDPFMGAGSTVAAASYLGYQSIGVELDDQYFDIAKTAIPKLTAIGERASQVRRTDQQRALFAG